MSAISPVPRLERPDFAHGQRLLPRDMRALRDYSREVRWLHNRVLHEWGIGLGLGVRAAIGDRVVTVEPGYALDCQGHDIVLAEPVQLQVPAIAGKPGGGPKPYALTVSWETDADIPPSQSVGGVCEGGGAVRRPERPLIRWQDPVAYDDTRVRPGLDIVLALVEVEDCVLAGSPDLSARRIARAGTSPYVATGSTASGATPWTFHPHPVSPTAVQTVVDTSAAGFRRVPVYFADLQGSRILQSFAGAGPGAAIDGHAEVTEPRADRFTLRVTLPRGLDGGRYTINPPAAFQAATLERLRSDLAWSVAWTGIES